MKSGGKSGGMRSPSSPFHSSPFPFFPILILDKYLDVYVCACVVIKTGQRNQTSYKLERHNLLFLFSINTYTVNCERDRYI